MLVDNLGKTVSGSIHVNVLPAGGGTGAPGVLAPTPKDDVEAAIFVPTGRQIHAGPSGMGGGTETIQSVTVEFDANVLGNSVPVASPVAHVPALPVSGTTAATAVSWTPPITAIGQWDFDYHLLDSFGQTFDFSLTVNVRHAVLALGVAPYFAQDGPSPLDILRVEPILLLPMDLDKPPEVIVPDQPSLIDPYLFPADVVKTSDTLIFKLGMFNSTYATGSGLDLIATQPSELGEPLPYEFAIPGF